MNRYSIQYRDWIFIKSYGRLSFAKGIRKSIGKSISKNLRDEYSQKYLDHTSTDALKTA